MSSQVEICNMALTRLGSSRIISLGDNTVESKALSAIYNQAAKYVMSMGPWPSIVKRTTLAQDTSTPDFGFNYQYQLPTDPKLLRLLRINEFKLGDIHFQVEGDKLLTDESSASILYMAYITDTEAYDIYLEQAIVSQLVIELAFSRTGQLQASEAFMAHHEKKIQDLMNNAMTQNPTDEMPSDMFTDVRREG